MKISRKEFEEYLDLLRETHNETGDVRFLNIADILDELEINGSIYVQD